MQQQSLSWLRNTIALIIISAIAVITEVQAFPFALKPLSPTNETLENHSPSVVTVAMIYQPDCSWCKKQGKTLAKAIKQCQSSIKIALIGTKGNARQLKQELRHYHQDFPAFIADREFLRTIGGYQASPTTLVFDDKGKLIAKKLGFIPEEKLTMALEIISLGSCQI